ncbi:(2Fe-2S)-binding protein [Shewanella sp. VB17]|uniref:(2Fe-2S)-binding protein n=1 Tax=Shewanella sp. VB17 TaxID=2739432 RepID=UPI00156607D6|nr:2Fe-2S iron-sulfur cluster-binding protein [Shewanella sp. VB17]NRD74150.1 (2Fe-2S)-binding protein [Shewanella sp. VB17]
MNTVTVELILNGKKIGPIDVAQGTMMIQFLHEYLNLTGTKFGCGAGICHACVILEKTKTGHVTHRTCIKGVGAFNGMNLMTIEGHANIDVKTEALVLHPVQQAFIDHFSFQCGWCTSGFVNEAIGYYESLKQQPVVQSELRAALEHHLGTHVCRCTGYVKYYQAMENLILSQPELIR